MKRIDKLIAFIKRHPQLIATVLYNRFEKNSHRAIKHNRNYWLELCTYSPEYCAGALLTLMLNKEK